METCSVELLVTIFLAKLFLPIDNDPNIMSYSYQLLSLASNSPLSLKQNMQEVLHRVWLLGHSNIVEKKFKKGNFKIWPIFSS